MNVGNLVKHFLTEQLGVVIRIGGHPNPYGGRLAVLVMWTTQGLSLFGAGTEEWCDPHSLEVLTNT